MGLDSVELVMEVEKYFSISIPDREAEKANTVGKFVDCVAKILNVKSYDFNLRDDTFSTLKKEINRLTENKNDFLITDKVQDNLKIENQEHLSELEHAINLKLPGIYISKEKPTSLFSRFKNWVNSSAVFDFNEISWKKYIDVVLAHNLEITINPKQIKSKYEIYIALMRLIVDKIGVDYFEIGIEKIFTGRQLAR